jgi:serine/threonine protein kinase
MNNLPQRIGNYRLERRIGKGGTSEVWLGRHRALDERQVAIKLLLSQDQEWIDRFTREAAITSRLRHENIIQIYDHGYQPPYYYTIMEYVAGGALRDILKDISRLPLETALDVFRAAGTALDYAHAHGVIHRDVSPGNILIEQGTGRILLTDFGIARESGKVGFTTINNVMGTPGYLSPEHASSATAVTHLSDIYGLGIVLFEMLSGRSPWDHRPGMPDSTGGPFTTPKTLQSCGVEGLPPDVDRILQTMLAIEPSKRYPTAQAAIEELDGVFNRHTSPTRIVTPSMGANGSPTPVTPIRLIPTSAPAEPHPVEQILGPDLLKGPIQDARKRAEDLRDPQAISSLLNQWSDGGFFRRKLLGRQAVVHRVTNQNIYFYTLRVLYETREPEKIIAGPDYKAVAPPLEKEVGAWGVKLPNPKGFTDEPGGIIDLPGTLRVTSCNACSGIGKTTCPRCKGERRILAAREPQDARKPAGGSRTTAAITASSATAPPVLIPCPECSGAGGIRCAACDGVGRMIEKKTTTWSREAGEFVAHDDLANTDEKWLTQMCRQTEVYSERKQGGLRPEWQGVPALAALIKEAEVDLDQTKTRIVLSEVSISFIPVAEIVFDIGDSPQTSTNSNNTNTASNSKAKNGKQPPPNAGNVYSWRIYGFERRLPSDWRFLNWERVWIVILGCALAIAVLLLVLALALR